MPQNVLFGIYGHYWPVIKWLFGYIPQWEISVGGTMSVWKKTVHSYHQGLVAEHQYMDLISKYFNYALYATKVALTEKRIKTIIL